MRAIACITLLIWGAISTKNASGSFCSSGSLSPHTGFCYHVHPEKNAKVKDSRKICRDTYGGDIPSIFSDDENTFIKNLLEPESHDNYWIGVNDRLVEDDFRDVMRNERLIYSNWRANEPDNAFSADCAAMERSSGEWIDYTCSTLSFFAVGIICQQPPNPNPYTLCPANMLNYVASSGTECYWFSMDKLTALQAESHCASMGSKLAFIEDQDLDLFLYSYQQSAEMDTLWIGTQQLLDSSSYRSVEFGTTTPVYYDNFMSTYSGSENLICAAKIRSEGGKWNQLNCDDGTYHFVCQFTNGTETTTSAETTVATTTTTTIPSTTPANTTLHTTTEATTPSSTTNPTTPTPTTTESTTAVLTTTQATTTPTTTEPTTPKPTTTEEDTTTLPSTTATTTHNPTTTAVTTTIPTTYASTTQLFTTDRVTTTTATTSETTATSIAISTETTDALARSPEAVAFKSLSTGYSIDDTVVDSLLKEAQTLEAVSFLMIRGMR